MRYRGGGIFSWREIDKSHYERQLMHAFKAPDNVEHTKKTKNILHHVKNDKYDESCFGIKINTIFF